MIRKFIAKKTVEHLDDFGASGIYFTVTEIKKDKWYYEDKNNLGFVIDDIGERHKIGTKKFEKLFKEI